MSSVLQFESQALSMPAFFAGHADRPWNDLHPRAEVRPASTFALDFFARNQVDGPISGQAEFWPTLLFQASPTLWPSIHTYCVRTYYVSMNITLSVDALNSR